MLIKFIMASLFLCSGCINCSEQSDTRMDGVVSVQERTNCFLNDLIDDVFETPPPRKLITYLGNSISGKELTQSHGELQSPVYARLNEMVAKNDKSKALFYKVEIFDDKTSRQPVVVAIICLKEGISASGPVFFESIFIDLDIRDYTMAPGGVWDM